MQDLSEMACGERKGEMRNEKLYQNMAKDLVGGNAAVFKTLGASNHKNGERQKEDYYATEPAATEWLCKIEQFTGGNFGTLLWRRAY